MKNTKWLSLGVLALTAVACDPYTEENKGALHVLSAFAVSGNSSDNATALFEATGTDPYTIPSVVDPGGTVFFVKANKLLDGSKIQSTVTSCVPAAEVALTVNGVASPADWYTCYVPSTSTSAEGGSMVIYQGSDIDMMTGYFDSAALQPGFYSITATVTDKQANTQTVTIACGVFSVALDATATSTTVDLSIDLGTAGDAGATAFDVQRAPNVVNAAEDDEPGEWATIAEGLAITTTTYADAGLTAETKYWYRVVLTNGTQSSTSQPIMVTTEPAAP